MNKYQKEYCLENGLVSINAENVPLSEYIEHLENKLAQTEQLILSGVSQRSELFADQDNRDFILWQRDRDITRLENGKYKWREFEYNREFFLEKYIEDRNKANCG